MNRLSLHAKKCKIQGVGYTMECDDKICNYFRHITQQNRLRNILLIVIRTLG